MRILFIGDVFGSTGRRVLAERLESLLAEERVDVCIANGENAAGGVGITANVVGKLHHYGVDVITGGNHSLAHASKEPETMDMPHVLRPHNFPPGNPGHGTTVFTSKGGTKIGVINLQGRTFFHDIPDCPFRLGLQAARAMRKTTPVIFVDFHAEATSEKIALAYHLEGVVSAVVGTHTHVQTADERILEGGTAFITDAGMTGPENSAIGMKKELVLQKFLLQGRVRFEQSRSGGMLNAVVITVDENSGKARDIKRIFERFPF
ncbi:MAG: metallophosphoesterase [Chitinivibrionales bacterium]|nr:metallophosphoesterase [Chitinivibrionales bacterium]